MTPDPADPEDDDRWRIAYHEAGHAVTGLYLCGEIPEIISIRGALGYRGACIGGSWLVDSLGDAAPALHIGLADPRLRAKTELAITCLLAGTAAEALVPRRVGWSLAERPPDPDRQRAAALAESLANLSPRATELLSDAERQPADEWTDGVYATALAQRLVAEEAASHVIWLDATAERYCHWLAPQIGAVASELYRVTILSGADAALIAN